MPTVHNGGPLFWDSAFGSSPGGAPWRQLGNCPQQGPLDNRLNENRHNPGG
jgi:hypothetical protein